MYINKDFSTSRLLNYFTYEQLINNNVHLGDSVQGRNWFEENFFFIEGSYNRHFILSLSLTVQTVRKVLFIVERNASKKLKILFSIQNPLLFARVRSECYSLVKYGFYYINSRWVGGILTNFKTLSFNIFPFLAKLNLNSRNNLRKKVYRKWIKLLKLMEGLRGAKILPSFTFASDLKINPWLFRESFALLIPSAGIIDSDAPQTVYVTYAIPSNDDSYKSILFFFLLFKNAFLIGRLRRKIKFAFYLNLSLLYIRKNNIHYDLFSFLILFYFFRKTTSRLFLKKERKIRLKKS
jgi:small subunit ribosomal protein S2